MTLPAPGGMDVTSDPVQTATGKAQLIVNFQTNYAGKLRALCHLQDVLPLPRPLPIDGIAWYYQATLTNPQQPPFPTDLLLFFQQGSLFYSVPSADPFNVPFGTPIPIAGSNLGNSYFQGGVFVGRRIRSAALADELIFVQEGGIAPQRFFSGTLYGTHYWQAGIVAPPLPTSSQTGTGITGTYEYKVTYYDERGRESSPSPISAPLTIANKAIQVTIAWGADLTRAAFDRQIRGAYVYRNLSGGSVWYRVGNVPIGRINPLTPYTLTTGNWILHPGDANDKATDAEVSTQPLAPNPGENDPPNPASVIAVHKNRVFCNDVTDNATLQVSNLSSPTQWTSIPAAPLIATDGVQMTVGSDQGDAILALVEFGDVLAIFKRRGVYYLWGSDLTDFTIQPIHIRGCIAPDSAVRCDNVIFYLSTDGVYAASYAAGESVEKVSQEIEAWLFQTTEAQREASFAYFVDRRYHLCIGSSTFVYDFTSQGWHVEIFGSGDLQIGIPGFPVIHLIPPSQSGSGPGSVMLPGGGSLPNSGSGSPPSTGGGGTPFPATPSDNNTPGGGGMTPGFI